MPRKKNIDPPMNDPNGMLRLKVQFLLEFRSVREKRPLLIERLQEEVEQQGLSVTPNAVKKWISDVNIPTSENTASHRAVVRKVLADILDFDVQLFDQHYEVFFQFFRARYSPDRKFVNVKDYEILLGEYVFLRRGLTSRYSDGGYSATRLSIYLNHERRLEARRFHNNGLVQTGPVDVTNMGIYMSLAPSEEDEYDDRTFVSLTTKPVARKTKLPLRRFYGVTTSISMNFDPTASPVIVEEYAKSAFQSRFQTGESALMAASLHVPVSDLGNATRFFERFDHGYIHVDTGISFQVPVPLFSASS